MWFILRFQLKMDKGYLQDVSMAILGNRGMGLHENGGYVYKKIRVMVEW